MEEAICREKHRRVDEKLELHERRINNHSERIDRIEVSSSRMDEKLSGLVTQLSALNTNLKWFIGLMVGSFVAFFFYAVQNNMFK